MLDAIFATIASLPPALQGVGALVVILVLLVVGLLVVGR